MENNTTISERLQLFIDYKGLNANSMSKAIGASNSYFNKVLKDNLNIGSSRIEKILRAFPDLNAEWLVTGEGVMLKSNSQSSSEQKLINSLRGEVIELQNKLISCLENRLHSGKETHTKKSS